MDKVQHDPGLHRIVAKMNTIVHSHMKGQFCKKNLLNFVISHTVYSPIIGLRMHFRI